MKAYRRLATRFAIGRGIKEYHGHVVASQEAFFFIVPKGLVDTFHKIMGRSALELAIGMAGKPIDAATEVMQVELSDLPLEITEDPSWPSTPTNGHAFILPRNVVQKVIYPWYGSLEIHTAEERFHVVPFFFERPWIVRGLRQLGWQI